jgi:hypothetical protein
VKRILVIDDDTSRHRDIEAWSGRLGLETRVHATPPPEPDDPDIVILHAGYGRGRDGFPRSRRRAEAVHWFLGDPSYLFHEDLEAFQALGRRTGSGIPLVIITGGSDRDLPLDGLRSLAAGRRLVLWNVFGLLECENLDEVLAGPVAPRQARGNGTRNGNGTSKARVQSEIRHDLLNRLWNLALAADEEKPDEEEIAEIVRGEEDQSPLGALIRQAPAIGAGLRDELAEALEKAQAGALEEGLSSLVRTAIGEIESA